MVTLIEALPRSEMDSFEEYIELPNKQLTREEFLYSFYGDLIDSTLPLSEEKFNQLYDMSTESWKKHWQHWKQQGILA